MSAGIACKHSTVSAVWGYSGRLGVWQGVVFVRKSLVSWALQDSNL